MDETYVTYADEEHVDNHDYDDNTDNDHDDSNDIYARACNARVNTSTYINGILRPGALEGGARQNSGPGGFGAPMGPPNELKMLKK